MMMPRSPSRPVLAAYFSLAATVGCGADVTGATTGATGTGGVPGASGGATGDAGSGGAGGMDSGSGVICHQCACVNTTLMGGCGEICIFYDNTGPNFCDGVPALSICTICLAMNCPGVDPTNPSACK